MSLLGILRHAFAKPSIAAAGAQHGLEQATTLDERIAQHKSTRPLMSVQVDGTKLIYVTPNAATKWRVDTLFIKEPDTIEWIRGFHAADTFVDIGANVGMYTIFAAKTRGVRTYAMEPESQNYALLNENIARNNLGDRVVAYCIALSDELSFSLLHMHAFVQGNSGHTFGEELDHNLQPRKPVFSQGCVAATLDMLVARQVIPVPTHIKIDVDGLEHKIIAGARETLGNGALRSVLIEINTNLEQHRSLIGHFADLGFSYDETQALRARRTSGNAKGTGNYVFRR